MKSAFDDALQKLGERIGISGLKLSETDTCTLEIGGIRTVIAYVAESAEFALTAEVGTLAMPLPEPVAAILLSANVRHRMTAGAALGVDEAGTVVLSQMFSADGIDARLLELWLSRFSETADAWHANVADLGRLPALAAETDAAGSDDSWIRA